jgi:hypothetical protein
MHVNPPDYLAPPDVVAAARDLIRGEGDGCVVSIWHLLDELSGKFGDRFHVSPDVYMVLDLIETLWADPHVNQVPDTGLVGGNPLPVRRNMASTRMKASRRRQQATAMVGDR